MPIISYNHRSPGQVADHWPVLATDRGRRVSMRYAPKGRRDGSAAAGRGSGERRSGRVIKRAACVSTLPVAINLLPVVRLSRQLTTFLTYLPWRRASVGGERSDYDVTGTGSINKSADLAFRSNLRRSVRDRSIEYFTETRLRARCARTRTVD